MPLVYCLAIESRSAANSIAASRSTSPCDVSFTSYAGTSPMPAGLAIAIASKTIRPSAAVSSLKHSATSSEVNRFSPCSLVFLAAFTSGANSSTMPRFVFVPTNVWVCFTACSTLCPNDKSARSKTSPIATALIKKSENVTSSKSAPRCTLPGFGAVTSSTQASVAILPNDSESIMGPHSRRYTNLSWNPSR